MDESPPVIEESLAKADDSIDASRVVIPHTEYLVYQLHAMAGVNNPFKEAAFLFAILSTIMWLRSRFKEQDDIPVQLMPEQSQDHSFSFDSLSSLHYDAAFKLDIIWLPNEKVWTAKLFEPGINAQNAVAQDSNDPELELFFETNISFRLFGDRVECAFKIIASEPYEINGAPLTISSMPLVCTIALDPDIGLWQGGWKLQCEAHCITTDKEYEDLTQYIHDKQRTMPIIVAPERTSTFIHGKDRNDFWLYNSWTPLVPVGQTLEHSTQDKKTIERRLKTCLELTPDNAKKVETASFDWLGLAQCFFLTSEQQLRIIEQDNMLATKGIHFYEPRQCGGQDKLLPIAGVNSQKLLADLSILTSACYSIKCFDYGDCLFVKDAQDLEGHYLRTKLSSALDSLEKQKREFEEEKARHRSEVERLLKNVNTLKGELKERERKAAELRNEIKSLKAEAKELSKGDPQLIRQLTAENDRLRSLNVWQRARYARHSTQDEIPAWVENELAGRLILHKRALHSLATENINNKHLKILYDALEFLAYEYRDFLLGELKEDEFNTLCSAKYDRHFTVREEHVSIRRNREYAIKYGSNGAQNKESLLNRHLKYGQDSQTSLHIYFLWDTEIKLIVVGSLPKPLSC